MRKILLTLFALIMVTGLMSCSPHSNITYSGDTPPDVTIDFHGAPFEGHMYLNGASIDHKVFKDSYANVHNPFNYLRYNKYTAQYLATSADKSFLYVLRIIGVNEATLETYPKCSRQGDNGYHENHLCHDDSLGYVCNVYGDTYYSTTPIAAYYFRYETHKYAFATKDFKLGEAVEIKGCWNIGPDRKYHEERSDYLDGFVYIVDKPYMSDCTITEAFCYRCEVDDKDELKPLDPSYTLNQKYKGYDSFNTDGETKEGWNNKISVFSGYSLTGWERTYFTDFPKTLADPSRDMTKVQVSDGSWIEVIETPSLKPANY